MGGQCIVVQTTSGPVVLTGDLIPTYENMEKNVPNGGHYDLEVISASMARVKALGLPILPGHDAAVLHR